MRSPRRPANGTRWIGWLGPERIREEVGSDAFHGGLLQKKSAQMHVGRFAVGLAEAAARQGARIHPSTPVTRLELSTGLDFSGVSLGSSSFQTLKKPQVAMLVEGGVSPTDAGELWHLLDTRFHIPVTLISTSVFNTQNINRYSTIIFPGGTYTAIADAAKEKLKTWVQNGGVIIGFENAMSWLTTAGLAKFDMKKEEEKKDIAKAQPYGDISENKSAQETSGAIFEADVDLTNPLFYGYSSSKVAMFKPNNLFMEKAKGAYANPLTYGNTPLMSGYISKPNYEKMKNTSGVGISVLGKGRVIGFTENLAFRSFWFGPNKMVMNAIFYGGLLSAETSR